MDEELRERVAALEERVAAVEEAATDAQGREWTIGDLMAEFQLSRRQALAVFGLLVGGYPLLQALTQVAQAGSDEVGTIGGPSAVVDAYLEDVYDKNGNQPLSLPGDGSVNIEEIEFDSSLMSFPSFFETVVGGTAESKTGDTIYGPVGEILGPVLSVNDIGVGSMVPSIRLICELKISNSSDTGFARLESESGGTAGNLTNTEVSTQSTSFTELDSGWIDLTTNVTDQTAPIRFFLNIKTSDSAQTVEVRRASVLVGPRPS